MKITVRLLVALFDQLSRRDTTIKIDPQVESHDDNNTLTMYAVTRAAYRLARVKLTESVRMRLSISHYCPLSSSLNKQ